MKRSEIAKEQAVVRDRLAKANIVLPPDASIEIADFGLGQFRKLGLGLIVRVNEPEYCGKWLTLEPGQECPAHFHKLKKETFFVHEGDVEITTPNEVIALGPGGRHTLMPLTLHSFRSSGGAIIEEISTHDENEDSYFIDAAISRETSVEED